jgi:CelD/BcsL family acetyltransferase involved in cellulose biosynthesis
MGTVNVLESSGQAEVRSSNSHKSALISSGVMQSSEPAKRVAHQVQTTTYFSWSSLAEVMPGWERILRENRSLSIFSTPEWLGSWWEAFGANRHLVVLAFSNSAGELIGLVPLYWESMKHPVFARIKQLRLLGDGSGDSDNLDFIVRPGEENRCVAALIEWIGRQRNCGVCCFNTLPENSVVAKLLAEGIETARWPFRITTTPNSAVPLPSAWESYIEGLSPKFRRLITRCRKKLDSQYQVRFRRCESVSEIPSMLDTLYGLHQKRWNSVNEPGSFGSIERRDLYARMANAFFERGWLELWCLDLNGRAVAAQMSFRYRDRVYGLQEGFDPAFFTQHVGYVLRAAMFEYFIRSGVKVYDFLGGFTPQKQRWGAEGGVYTNLQFATPWSVASCCLAFDKGAAAGKEWLRHHLPSSAWNVLHRVKINLMHECDAKESYAASAPAPESVQRSTEGIPCQ